MEGERDKKRDDKGRGHPFSALPLCWLMSLSACVMYTR